MKTFHTENINKPMKSLKHKGDRIRFVYTEDPADWNRVRTEAGKNLGADVDIQAGNCAKVARLVICSLNCRYRKSG